MNCRYIAIVSTRRGWGMEKEVCLLLKVPLSAYLAIDESRNPTQMIIMALQRGIKKKENKLHFTETITQKKAITSPGQLQNTRPLLKSIYLVAPFARQRMSSLLTKKEMHQTSGPVIQGKFM